MKTQKTIILFSLLSFNSIFLGCNSEQQERVTTQIRNTACEAVRAQTPAHGLYSQTQLQDQATGCNQGVHTIMRFAQEHLRNGSGLNRDELYETSIAWCLDSYGRADRPSPSQLPMDAGRPQVYTFNAQMLLGCNLGVTEALIYSDRLATLLTDQNTQAPALTSTRSPVLSALRNPLSQCAQAPQNGNQNLTDCIGAIPLTEEQLNAVTATLQTSHNQLIQQGSVAQRQAIAYETETQRLTGLISVAQARTASARLRVADLVQAQQDTSLAQQRTQRATNERLALLNDEQTLPLRTTMAWAQSTTYYAEFGRLQAQSNALVPTVLAAESRARMAEIDRNHARQAYERARSEHEDNDNHSSSHAPTSSRPSTSSTPNRSYSPPRSSSSNGGGYGSFSSRPSSSSRSNSGGYGSFGGSRSSSSSSSSSRSNGGGSGSFRSRSR